MSALAPTLEAFFTERLLNQRHASPRTIAAYRDTLRLLLVFTRDCMGKTPAQLDLADLNAELVSAFLTHLEQQRHNSAAPAMPGSRPSTRCSVSPRYVTPSMPG
jgi:integrase/recombinase XerD